MVSISLELLLILEPYNIIQNISSSFTVFIYISVKKARKSRQAACNEDIPAASDMGGEPPGDIIPDVNGECQYCFMRPCITARELHFVGSGQSPNDNNSGIRKGHVQTILESDQQCSWLDRSTIPSCQSRMG